MKKCNNCGKEKLLFDFFLDRRTFSIHPLPICKDCKNEKNRNWYLKNKEKRIKQTYEYYKAHPEIYKKAQKRYSQSEKGRIYFKKFQKEYRKKYPQKFQDYERKRSQTEKRKQQLREKDYRRRSQIKLRGRFTQEDFIQKLKYYGWRCFYCGIPLTLKTATRDHRFPLSENGWNIPANIVPACIRCNSKKGAKEYFNFIKNESVLVSTT